MEKSKRVMTYHLTCPWCGKGETLADRRAKVTISCCCPKCGRTYRADLDEMMTERSAPQKRLGRKYRTAD